MKVVFILGPTGVGKSRLAVKLAHENNGQIISSDSVQIYKGFDIGSAKVTKEEMEGVPHHLIDICQPQDYFSVSDFVDATRAKIKEISKAGDLPIVVGGTGLYINSLLGGYNFGGTAKDDNLRAELELLVDRGGVEPLVKMLEDLSPELAKKVDTQNKVRLIRAIEIAKNGTTQMAEGSEYDYKIFALTRQREALYETINARASKMIDEGLIEEVKGLLETGVSRDAQPMRAIGYKEVISYLEGEIDKAQMQQLIAQHSRNYAKRQMTYLRGLAKNYPVDFVDMDSYNQGEKYILEEVKKWLC